MCEKYIIGNGPAPDWCRGLISHYQLYGNQVGYEFHGHERDFNLRKGDALIKHSDGRIQIKRKVRE